MKGLKHYVPCNKFTLSSCYHESCRPIFKKENILTVVNLYILDRCTYIFKNPQLYKRNHDIHKYNTRNKNDINISAKSSKNTYHDIQLFNHLPLFIKNSPTEKLFKSKLKAILQLNPFYSIREYLDYQFDMVTSKL